jgi:DNA-binding Lrp family transcriptional regulator
VHVRRRLAVSEAAEELGISAEAVRSRVKRGTLRSIKEGGTVYVLLPAAQTRPGDDQTTPERDQTRGQTTPERDRAGAQAELVESLLEQVAYMREQLAEEREARRRADTIMAQLSQANAEQARTIRALEAPQEPRDEPQGPQTAAETTERVEDPDRGEGAQEGTERRSWWRRWFGA